MDNIQAKDVYSKLGKDTEPDYVYERRKKT